MSESVNNGVGERIRIIPSSVVKANDAARQESRGSLQQELVLKELSR